MKARVPDILDALERRGTRRARDSMLRYGIIAPKAFGVPMATLQQMAKGIGRDHELAAALWETGWYEARMLASLVDEPDRVTATLIERAAADDRNFVKKGVSWALRSIGRRNATLNAASISLAARLVESPDAAARWIGRGALKELTSPAVQTRLAKRQARPRNDDTPPRPKRPNSSKRGIGLRPGM